MQTISRKGEGLYKEKGSKFYSVALHAATEAECRELIDWYANKHHKSRHICYAYILHEPAIERSSDAGEPNNTAGPPLLNQLKQFDLVQSIVIVARFFGGVKLGKGGLIRAYKQAAFEAVDHAEKKTYIRKSQLTLKLPASELNKFLNIFSGEKNARIISETYGESCSLKIELPEDRVSDFTEKAGQIDEIHFL